MNPLNVAALFAAHCRPRQLKLSPRTFQSLARVSNGSQPSRRVFNTGYARNITTGTQRAEVDNVIPSSRLSFSKPLNDSDAETAEEVEDQEVVASIEETKSTFRTLLRTVPKSVVIVSARLQDEPDDRTGTVAATVSSFTPVAFEPDLHVSFNLKQDSATFQTLAETKFFCVTFPTSHRQGKALAEYFAKSDGASDHWLPYRPPDSLTNNFFVERGIKYPPCAVIRSPLDMRNTSTRESSGLAFAAWYEYESCIPVGDHVVVIAKALPIMVTADVGPAFRQKPEVTKPFFSSQTTLLHVHGTFDYDRWYKQDDLFYNKPSADKSEMLAFYNDRLDKLRSTPMKWDLIDTQAKRDKHRISGMEGLTGRQKQQYEVYYAERIARLGSESNSPVTDINCDPKNILNEDQAPRATDQQLSERRFIQKRQLSSVLALKQERRSYYDSLLMVQQQFSQARQQGAEFHLRHHGSGEFLDVLEDFSADMSVERLRLLQQFWEDRLRLLSAAVAKRLLNDSLTKEARRLNFHQYLETTVDPVVTQRKDWPANILRDSIKQYEGLAYCHRIVLLDLWSRYPEPDEKISAHIDKLMAQYETTLAHSHILHWMSAKQRADKTSLDPELTLPSDQEIIKSALSSDPAHTGSKHDFSHDEVDDLITKAMKLSKKGARDEIQVIGNIYKPMH